MEHFATLFDRGFLPQGLSLHQSLEQHAGSYHLWVLCMDEATEDALRVLDLPHVTAIPLRELEGAALRQVKAERNVAEYCWTLTPFLPTYVLDHGTDVDRVTYLDADVFFFADPRPFFAELEQAHKTILITEHGFAPEYAIGALWGRFCVQFVTAGNDPSSRRVLRWWQERCVEWCFARLEDGKFGDQGYLDAWPELFPEAVHVLSDTRRTLAPWNVEHVSRAGPLDPVFYHFHGLRLHARRRATLFSGYRIGEAGEVLYDRYLVALAEALETLERHGLSPRFFERPPGLAGTLRRVKRRLWGVEREVTLPAPGHTAT